MFLTRLDQLNNTVKNCECTTEKEILSLGKALQIAHLLLKKVKESHKTVYVIGNGGSAGIASHFCVDLINGLNIRAMTLFDSNVMTCMSNDYGYEKVFSHPLQTLLQKEDLLVAISSSGRSNNILNATTVAKQKKAQVITLSGFDSTNSLREMGDLNFYLGSHDYGLVEMGHFFLLHTIIDAWKSNVILSTFFSYSDAR